MEMGGVMHGLEAGVRDVTGIDMGSQTIVSLMHCSHGYFIPVSVSCSLSCS